LASIFATARGGEASEDLDVDLFFEHRKGELDPYRPIDVTPAASFPSIAGQSTQRSDVRSHLP
jgi:hypothetical protein